MFAELKFCPLSRAADPPAGDKFKIKQSYIQNIFAGCASYLYEVSSVRLKMQQTVMELITQQFTNYY